MISHDVTFPAEAKDTSLYLEIFLQQTWITRETLPRMRRKHDQTDANKCKHGTQLWGKDEMMSTEAAVSRSLPRFAATTISLAHGPPTGISCHLSLASGITSIISLYILCYLVTTVYQQGAIKLPLFGGTNKGNWRKGDESHTTNSKRVWMHARLSFIYILSRCVSMQLSILCLGNPLVADLPLKLPLHHNTAIVEEQTMPARYDMIRYDDIKWNEMKATMNGYEHLWNRITAASNLNLPFSPIVSVLRASRNPISLQDREDWNILGAHLAPISSRSHPRWKQCWVQQVKKKSHTRHTQHTHENHQKPPKVVLLGTFLQIFKHFESSLSTSQWWAQQNSQEVNAVATRPNSTLLQLSADLCPMRRYGLSPKFWGSWWGQAKLSTFSSFRYSGFFVTELHLPGNFGGDKEATSFLSRNRLLEHLSLHPSLRTLVSWMLQSLQGLWIHSQPLLTGTAYVHSGHSKQESVPIWKPFGLNKVYP